MHKHPNKKNTKSPRNSHQNSTDSRDKAPANDAKGKTTTMGKAAHEEKVATQKAVATDKPYKGKPRIGISMGDLNGVGIEVIIKTFLDKRMFKYCTPIVYGSSRVFSYHRKVLQIDEFQYNITNSVKRLKTDACNILNCWQEEVPITIGRPNPKVGRYALKSIEAAIYDVGQGNLDAVVTAPVNKHVINSTETPFKGHTEYITQKFNIDESLMLLIGEKLKVGLVTNHLPISAVANAITPQIIKKKIGIMYQSLQKDFGIIKPKIAVLALNPHAGDDGLIGEEDLKIIQPTVEKMAEKGTTVFGPFAADGFFGNGLHYQFDAILAMYHDQGLVPFKALSFGAGVNFTAGLPIVRTSPDHGTAYDIAGKNKASEDSFRKSIFTAIDIVNNRRNYNDMNANKLGNINMSEMDGHVKEY